MQSRGVYSLHSINLLIADDLVWAWWFDRQNVIQTSALNFVKDMPYFLALLVAFQRFNKSDWGVEPSLVHPSIFIELGPPDVPIDVEFKDWATQKDFAVRITNPSPAKNQLLRGAVLKGRATCVIDAQSATELHKDKKLVVKVSWPETSRNNETKVIDHAISEFKKLEELDPELKLLKFLPKLFASKDILTSNTGRINEKIQPEQPAKESSSPRVLRLLVFKQLEPLEEIKPEKQFTDAWLDCFKCHYLLWSKGIQHGDISVWNMMWDPDKDSFCGVLNDFDLAVLKGSGMRGTERTGTLPFMARDLLDPMYHVGNPERLYTHEVESFIWVLTWLTLRGVTLPSNYEWRIMFDKDDTIYGGIQSVKTLFLSNCERLDSIVVGTQYKHTWEKCKKFMALLVKLDRLPKALKKINKSVDGNVEQRIHDEVIKIMITDNDKYSVEEDSGELDDFYRALIKR